MEFDSIPDILKNASIEIERSWPLKKMGELLSIAYQSAEHPVLKGWKGHKQIDIFRIDSENLEYYKMFNRTIVERTIMHSEYYGTMNMSNGRQPVMIGKGIEFAIANLESFLLVANKLLVTPDNELDGMYSSIHFFLLTDTSKVTTSIQYFMSVCNDLIGLTYKQRIDTSLENISEAGEQVKFLLKQKASLLKSEDQFDPSTFKKIMNDIDIELSYHKEVQEFTDISTGLKDILNKFFAERNSRISSSKLLLLLLEEKFDEFCTSLSELVLQLFSYHDVGTQEPEKVYHAFLIGVLNSFKESYKLESNRESGTGRFDIMLIPESLEDTPVIIEIKRSPINNKEKIEELLDAALDQVVTNRYSVQLKVLGHKRFLGLAAVFYGKELYLKHKHYPV